MTSPLQHRRFQFSLRAVIVATVLAGVAVGAVIRWLPYYRAGKAFDSANDGESFPRRAAMREALVHTKSFRDAIASYSGTPQITTHPTMDTANNFGESVWIMELKRGWFVEFKELNGVPTATRVKSYRHEDRAEDAAEWNAK